MTQFVNAAEVFQRLATERTRRAAESPAMQCRVCWYVYKAETGCPETNTPPGTPFTELPVDWVCPRCGAGRDTFLPVSKSEEDEQ